MAGPCQEIIFVRIFARLNAINIATHVMSQHDRNNIASSLTFALVHLDLAQWEQLPIGMREVYVAGAIARAALKLSLLNVGKIEMINPGTMPGVFHCES
jgi:hypothetical protein